MIPTSRETEDALLGALLMDNGVHGLEGFEEGIFFFTETREVLEHARRCLEHYGRVDTALLITSINIAGALTRCGGAHYLATLSNKCSTPEAAGAYIKQLKELEKRRRLLDMSSRISNEVSRGSASSGHISEIAREAVAGLSDEEGISTPRLLAQEADRAIQGILDGSSYLLKTGIEPLDRAIGGLRKECVAILAARPAMGKTTMALQIAVNVAIHAKTPCLWIGLEMTQEQLVLKLVECISGVHMFGPSKLVEMGLRAGRVQDAMHTIADGLLFMDTRHGMLEDIIPRAQGWIRSMRAKHGDEVDPLVILDYIQRVKLRYPTGFENQDVGKVSGSFNEQIAKEMGVPVLLLSQLNRGLESRADKHPNMGDLKSSGDIEQDAAMILFLYRDYVYSKNEVMKGELEVDIAKNRFGETGVVDAKFRGDISRVY